LRPFELITEKSMWILWSTMQFKHVIQVKSVVALLWHAPSDTFDYFYINSVNNEERSKRLGTGGEVDLLLKKWNSGHLEWINSFEGLISLTVVAQLRSIVYVCREVLVLVPVQVWKVHNCSLILQRNFL
jgi:hypothetical protein